MINLPSRNIPRPLVAAILVFLLVTGSAAAIIGRLQQDRIQIERMRAAGIASSYAHAIQHRLEQAWSAAYTLAALIRQEKGGGIFDLDAVAKTMAPFYPNVSALQAAPDGIIRQIVPPTGNKHAIGRNLLEHSIHGKSAFLSLESSGASLVGPLSLTQKEIAVAVYVPVFLSDDDVFWGFASALVHISDQLDPVPLSHLLEQGFAYSIQRINPQNGQKQSIAASSATPIEPVEQTLEIPNDLWTLSIAPAKGWGDPWGFFFQTATGLLLGVLSAFWANLLVELKLSQQILRSKEAAQQISERRFRDLLSTASDWFWEQDEKFRFTSFSDGLMKVGIVADEFLGKTRWELPMDPISSDWVTHRAMLETHQPFRDFEYRVKSTPEEERWFSVNGLPIFDPEGNFIGYRGTSRDVTQRKRAELALAKAQENFHNAVVKNPVSALIVDLQGTVLFANPVARNLLGYSAEFEEGRRFEMLWSQNSQPVEISHPDGIKVVEMSIASTDWEGKPAYLVLLHDLTERRRTETEREELCRNLAETNAKLNAEIAGRMQMEVELRLAQKLEAVGQLAAGIAHEINTPIQYIGDNVHFLQTGFEDLQSLVNRYRETLAALPVQLPDQVALIAALHETEEIIDLDYLRENAPPAFERTLEGIGHVTSIVRAMKEFAHPDQREKSENDLNKAILNTLIVARNEYKYVADVKTHLSELPLVSCYLSDLNQVFLNLVVNAAHAITDVVRNSGQRGRITIATRQDGDQVEITITDTGGGIPDAIRNRVYDPFFTTKPVGKGTGQGLAIARSIVVDKHQGTLLFDSTPGRGTVFYVRLPIG